MHAASAQYANIVSDNSLLPVQRQAIIWTNAAKLLKLDPMEYISVKFIKNSKVFIQGNALENVVSEMAAILSQPQCVNLPGAKDGIFQGPLLLTWISNHMPSKVWDGITYPFLNFNGCTVEV